jgi:hypothetical protein
MGLLLASWGGAATRGKGLLCRGGLRWIHLIDQTGVVGRSLWDEDRGEKAKQANYNGHYPCTLLQRVCRLLNTHQLVAESAYVPGEPAAFGVLDQDDPAEDHTSKYNQDHKKEHVNEYLVVRFWLQNTRFYRD